MQKKILIISIICAMNTLSANDTEKLDDIVVTATRSEISTADAPGSVTVISKEEIAQKGGNNILDIIRSTPGLNIRGIGSGGRKSVNIRGMESKHTLILIDGKRIPSSNDVIGPNTDYQYDWVPSNRIERVEIVRGPMSVLYGADALGGVINIITKKSNKKLTGTIKLGTHIANGHSSNDGDGHNIAFDVSGGVRKNLQFNVNAQQSRRDSVDSKLKAGQSIIEGRKKQQLSFGLDWQPKQNHNIKLDFTNGQEDRWVDTATRKKKLYQSQYFIDRQHLSLGWKGSYGEKTASLRAYHNEVDISNKANNGVRSTATQNLKDNTLEGSLSFPIGEMQFITSGFEYRTETLKNTKLKNGKDSITLKSIYLQDEIDLKDNLVFTLGARLDDHSVVGQEISPRASVVWNTTDKLTLKASYGHGFKAPNIKQGSSDYVFSLGTIKISGNGDLKPETNDAFELGLNYNTEKYSINAAIFDNKVKNLIELTGPITNRTYQNVSKASLKGAEVSSKIALGKRLNLKTSYQYLDASDADGNALKHRPRHTLSSGITWDNNSWKLNLGAEYVSGQIIEHNRVSTDVPGYTLWNTSVQKVLNKNLVLSAGINNLTNVRLEDKSPAFLHEEYARTLRLGIQGTF